jgi:hypothetical protein
MRKLLFSIVACGALAISLGAGCLIEGGACATNDDCSNGQECLFAIGSCAAKGECKNRPSGPECNAVEEVCGCNGATVFTGCGFPSGFATGPTTGAPFCAADGGSD